MLIIPPPHRRSRRRRRARASAVPVPPAVPPVLVLATFAPDESGGGLLTLGFDRAVNLGALDPAQIIVDDAPETGRAFQGSAVVEVISDSQFTLGMSDAGSSGGMGILLLASLLTGIVAVVGGAAWNGTGSGVGLPLGEEQAAGRSWTLAPPPKHGPARGRTPIKTRKR